MTRGVVLWPDDRLDAQVRSIWDGLEALGIASLATESHRLHQPHVSLIVADDLAVSKTLEAVGELPTTSLPVLIEAVCVVPGNHLLLTLTAGAALLAEQSRVHAAALPFAESARSHYAPDGWLPHMTMARALTDRQLTLAISHTTALLPLRGLLTTGGVEDGTTGERWPATAG